MFASEPSTWPEAGFKSRFQFTAPLESADSEADKASNSKEKEKNILKALPSRQIATWRLKSAKKRGAVKKQKSYDGKVYMPVEDDGTDEPVFVDITKELAGKEGKYIMTKPLVNRVQERRELRNSSSERHSHSLSCFTASRYRIAMQLKQGYKRVKDLLDAELWRGHFKEIEGTFGNGILSYFTFLKWLLQINTFIFILTLMFLVIPQAIFKYKVVAVIVTPQPIVNASAGSATVRQTSSPTMTTMPVLHTQGGALNTSAALNQTSPRSISVTGLSLTRRDVPGFFGANTLAREQKKGCAMKRVVPNYSNKNVGTLVSDFMQGVGWINNTLMFYGSYSDKILIIPNNTFYNMPFAYFVVSGVCFLFVLLITLWSASSIVEDSYVKEGIKHYNSYANKVFGGWDMCIADELAADLKKKSFYNEMLADLAEDLRLANLAKRTRNETIKIYAIRITINVVVLGLSIAAGWAIFMAAQFSLKTAQGTPQTSQSKKTPFYSLLKSYALSLTLSLLNSVLPALFYFLSQLEDWNPRVRVNVDLARTVLLKLASVAVLMVSLYKKINTTCMLCWENAIAAEMYKLIWMDFIVVVVVVVAYHTPRRYVAEHASLRINLGQKIGRPIFSIPQNVLELVYGQCLIWIGMWFSPLLPLMGCVKFFIIFYAKKVTLKYNCRAEDKAYRAGRSNYFFMILLLGTLFLCVAAVAYGVTQIYPSLLYGPFRGLNKMYDIIPLTIRTLPLEFQDGYLVVSSHVFLVVAVLIICLGLYFFYATAKIYFRMIQGLKEELSLESRDKKYLLLQLAAEYGSKKTGVTTT